MCDEHGQGHNSHTSNKADNFAELLPLDLETTHEQLAQVVDKWVRQLPQAKSLESYARALVGTSSPDNPVYPNHKPDGEGDG
jgi:hypothetical protein